MRTYWRCSVRQATSPPASSPEGAGRSGLDPPAGAKFNAVRRGHCFLLVDGQPEPIGLAEGDCYLLTRPVAYTLFSDPDAPVQPAYPIFAAAGDGVAHAGDGDDMFLIGGAFSLGDRGRSLLLDSLPPIIHVPADTPAAATSIRWALDEIDSELRQPRLGSRLVAEHLALVLLIQVLRLHLARDPQHTSGWLAGGPPRWSPPRCGRCTGDPRSRGRWTRSPASPPSPAPRSPPASGRSSASARWSTSRAGGSNWRRTGSAAGHRRRHRPGRRVRLGERPQRGLQACHRRLATDLPQADGREQPDRVGDPQLRQRRERPTHR